MNRARLGAALGALLAFSGGLRAQDLPSPGSRSGPFVASSKTMGDLLSSGYDLKGALPDQASPTFLLQKEGSLFICGPIGDRTWTPCLEYQERKQEAGGTPPP